MYTVGSHLVEDMSWFFHLERSEDLLVEREGFNQALELLLKAGYRCRGKEAAWEGFVRLRSSYAVPLNRMADRLAIIPAQWIGDRTYLPHASGRKA